MRLTKRDSSRPQFLKQWICSAVICDREERTPADYRPGSPLGLYYARPVAAYLMTDAKNVEGYLLDERVALELPPRPSGE